MKAWVLHSIGDIRLEEVRKPEPARGEVLVEVGAAGICGSDIPRIYRSGAYFYPLIPGHEFSGTVAETGPGVDTAWTGARVGIFPLIPCRDCLPCQKKQYEMCRRYSYLGSRRDGGFAQYVSVPADNLLCLPASVTFEEAAMLEPMAVAVHAMRRIRPQKSERAVICGMGTIGTLLLMFLREAGMENIFVIGNKELQRQTALQAGLSADCYCDSRSEDVNAWVTEHTGGAGADLYFECVGKNETISQAVTLTAPGGRIMLVGNPASDIGLQRDVYWKILRNQLTMAGTWNSSFTHDPFDDWHYVLQRLEQKRIAPARLISQRFSLEEAQRGFLLMRDKEEEFQKIMISKI